MPRRRRPHYFRSLVHMVPGVVVGGLAVFMERLDQVRCSLIPKTIACPATLPDWAYIAAAFVFIGSGVVTSWAWYKDHVRGDYESDLFNGTDRYRD